MPDRTLPGNVDPTNFYSHIIRETKDRRKAEFSVLKHDDEVIDILMNDEWNYAVEHDKASRDAKEKWYPYRAAEIFDDWQVDAYESGEVETILKKRWSDLRQQVSVTYFNETLIPEINKALNRRELSQPKYQTDWGFRVKSKAEQLIANALRRYVLINEATGEHRRITVLYEPLFRVPDESRVIIPDFVIPEYCMIVEYAGLLEERNYKVGLWLKEDAMRRLGFRIILLRPDDLTDFHVSFNQKLRFYINLEAPIQLSEPIP